MFELLKRAYESGDLVTIGLVIVFIIAFIFAIRLFGAWMLRIDEVIKLLKVNISVNEEVLKSINKKDVADLPKEKKAFDSGVHETWNKINNEG